MNEKLELSMTIDTSTSDFNSISPGVRSLALDSNKTSLLVGTFCSEIYEVSILIDNAIVDIIELIMQGHYSPSKKVHSKCNNRQQMKYGD